MSHLLFVVVIHATLSQYGDVMMSCLNLLNVPIRKMFNESMTATYGLDSQQLELLYSACASTMMIGLVVGFLVMGYFKETFGTRNTAVVLRSLLGIVGSISMMISFATGRFEFFVLGHFISGVAAAFKVILLIYVAECSPDDKRGLTSMVVNSGGVVAVLLATPVCVSSLIGSDRNWFILPAVCGVMAAGHALVAVHFPQSPKQLYIRDHDEEEARAALKFYYGSQYDIDEVISEMETERRYETHESVSLKEIMKDASNRYSLFIVLLCAFVPPFSALNIKLQYLMSMLGSYGLSVLQANTAMTAMNAIALPVCFIAPLLIERFGRRKMFVAITLLCSLEWAALGAAQTFVDVGAPNKPSCWVFGVFGATMGQIAVNLGMLIMSPMMISEICPYNTRNAISKFTQVLPTALAIVEVAAFPSLASKLGAALFFLLSICCLALAITLKQQMLETAGMPIDEIIRRIHNDRSRANSITSDVPSYGSLI
ncbi:hypothetical protein Y032_0051g2128 [Ancylostoma ceylanicum]|uniref:Major facilitator superfamily (MFS) profile domain-containing protein n=1 Tax=Ancylostoma ceylanicum TaxID=53326 RepID=A0A016U7Z1_9BILA|nr:hypothetical protein Y032_0051g2128 [Ancylostoma ceylanicum]